MLHHLWRGRTQSNQEAANEIVTRVNDAKRPVLIVGFKVYRFHLRQEVLRLAEQWNVPVASSFLGRGVFPTLHPLRS